MKSLGCVIIFLISQRNRVHCVDLDWQFAAANFMGYFDRISLIGTGKNVRKIEFFKKLKFEKSVFYLQ